MVRQKKRRMKGTDTEQGEVKALREEVEELREENERLRKENEELRAEAKEWAITRGSRSGRVAWQYIQDLAGRLGKRLD